MIAGRTVVRWLILVTVVVATVVMHAQVSGACADHDGASTMTSMETGALASSMTMPMAARSTTGASTSSPTGSLPEAPSNHAHLGGQICQATVPYAPGTLLMGALVALAAIAVTRPRASGSVVLQRVAWWSPPPRPASLCTWRI